VAQSFTAVARPSPDVGLAPFLLWFPFNVGVGHNPDPVSSVRGIDGTSRNNKCLDGVSKRLEVFQYFVEDPSSCMMENVSDLSNGTAVVVHRRYVLELENRVDSSNVLTKDPSGACLGNNAAHFWPEVAVICRALALPGMREGLTGKSPSNEGDASVSGAIEGEDVGVEYRTC
jgi:hypothetical protein